MREDSIIYHLFYLIFFSVIFLGALLMLKSTKEKINKNKGSGFYIIKFYNLLSKYAIFLTGFIIIYSIISILKLALLRK
jgi:hypothetical protein